MSDTHRYHDEGTVWIQWAYRKQLDLAPGTNLIHHYFERIGLPDWVPKSQELVRLLRCWWRSKLLS